MRYTILIIFMLIFGFVHGQIPKVSPLPINSPAPEFHLPATDGKMYSLSDFDNYPIFAVIFTCNHCPTAQAYEDRIIELVDEYRPKGVGFVAISPNAPEAISLSELGYTDLSDDLEDMRIRAQEKNFNFPYLYDGDNQKVSIAYGPAATPHVFVFDQDRKLRYRGRIDDTENPYQEPENRDMAQAIDALLSNKKVSEPTTKTFGCSTKWAWKGDWVQKQQQQWAKESVEITDISLKNIPSLINNPGKKLRLINIWATWCGPCLIEFPDLVDINRMYRNRDFEFISLSTDKPGQKDNALNLLQNFEASNQNYIFTGSDIYELIEAVDPEWEGALPYSLLVKPGGEILYKVQGPIDPLMLKRKIIGYLGRFYADDK